MGQSRLLTLTAYNPTTGNQVTRYVYGTDVGGVTPEIYRNDLLRAVIYPDSDDPVALTANGGDGVYDRVEMKYNRLGEIVETTDQNGTVHAFDYDGLGRQRQDRVTTVGSGVDGAVLRIERTYDKRGMPEHVRTYDNAAVGSGAVKSDILREYDDLGRLAREYQEHADAGKDASTLYVEYAHADLATYGLRPTSARYPNGRKVHFDYSGADDDVLNRLTAVKDDSGGSPGATLAEYAYLGLGTISVEDFVEPDVRLAYYDSTAGTYPGFDNFNRVIQQLWRDYGATADRDKFTYGYDRASNRTYRENAVSKALGTPVYLDEFYTYDLADRLTHSARGQLTGGPPPTGIATPTWEEDFGLDATGNWSTYTTTALSQTRGHNVANELTTATSWATSAEDRAGNMTTVPKPSNPATGLTLKYDAWNRLVEVKEGETVLGQYRYDGDGRRICKYAPGASTYEHAFYLGEQLVETRETASPTAEPEALQAKYQWIWSARYIDAAILRDENAGEDSLCDDDRYYFLADANMNVTTLVDTAGDAVERYVYDPYGRTTIYDATWSNTRATSSYNNQTLFTGRTLDPETGFYFYRARYYSAELGRFLGRDPIGYWAGDVNLYRYVFGIPTGFGDPSGRAVVIPPEVGDGVERLPPVTPPTHYRPPANWPGSCYDIDYQVGPDVFSPAPVGGGTDLLPPWVDDIRDHFGKTPGGGGAVGGWGPKWSFDLPGGWGGEMGFGIKPHFKIGPDGEIQCPVDYGFGIEIPIGPKPKKDPRCPR